MAKSDSSLVTVAKPLVTGALSACPIKGAQLPTNATSELSGFTNLGYVSEDGLTNSFESESADIKAWGGDTVLTVATSRKETFEWSFIQALDADVLKEIFGEANVTDSDGTLTIKHNSKEMPYRVFVIEMLMTGGRVKRIVIPKGKITSVGAQTYKDGEVVAYPVTLSCAPDKDGNTAIEYISTVEE
ncbi:phage tail protein [Arcanobacterium buesumense]|uniref:Phage tail protein n=1 Tax=Arcanobacterium buesumense TaxID=2722751 RepID=A0A6H2ELR2_9ACTO|nr:phage tail protein [Arcanobacterium buesumense]QJC22007.1 phage tail protein [Arcanobacterium buesumense]